MMNSPHLERRKAGSFSSQSDRVSSMRGVAAHSWSATREAPAAAPKCPPSVPAKCNLAKIHKHSKVKQEIYQQESEPSDISFDLPAQNPTDSKVKPAMSGSSSELEPSWPASDLDFGLDSLGEGDMHSEELEGDLLLGLDCIGAAKEGCVQASREGERTEGGGESVQEKQEEGSEEVAERSECGTVGESSHELRGSKRSGNRRGSGNQDEEEGSKRQGSVRERCEKSCSGVSQKTEEEEEEGETNGQSGRKGSKKESSGKRKVKVDWTPDLHRRFVQAVEQLGVEKAIPSRILELMGVQCLTRHNIASHLQKYRSHRRHLLAREAEAANWHQRRPMDVTSLSRMRRDGTAWVTLPINPSPPQPAMGSRPAVGIPPHMPSILPAPSHHMAMAAAAHMPMQVMHPHPHAHPHPAAAAAMHAAHSGAHPHPAAASSASASAMGMPLHVWGHPAMDHSPMHMWQQPMGMCPPPAWYGPDGSLWQYPAMMQAPPPMMDAVWGQAPSSLGMPAVPGTPYCATQRVAPSVVCGTPAAASTITAMSTATTAMSADISLSTKEVSTAGGEEGSVADGSGTVCSSAAAAAAPTMDDLMLLDDNMPGGVFLGSQDLTSLDFAVMSSCFSDDFPENASNDVLDAAISEALTNPMTPLPLGLKPPSMDGIMAELEKQGICMASSLEGAAAAEEVEQQEEKLDEDGQGTLADDAGTVADVIDDLCSGDDVVHDIELPASWDNALDEIEP